MNFSNQIVELHEIAVTPDNATAMMDICARIEQENPYIPSDFKWILDFKRFQIERIRGEDAAALVYLKAAIALAPYRDDLLRVYREAIVKTPAKASLALIISCSRYQETALRLAEQFEDAQFPYLIVTGADTSPIDHPRAVQVNAPDNYEGLPRKVTAALHWVYENVGSQVGILKVDDDQSLVDPQQLKASTFLLKERDAYAGIPITSLTHDRCWHWNKCEDPALNRRAYGKPFYRPWARGGAYYLGSGPLEKFVLATMRFPGLLEGEYYEDKFVGDLMALEDIPLVELQSDSEFGLSLDHRHRFGGT
ncbi:hypothetical protein G4G28_06455 [Massilia sp. Dwa41.01b]|uniref:hypothetical protein n=1 Tax=unclassified Massilia TaxID=2609279 RepID=UPI001601FD0D|nr:MULTISPECIES: hypothetical protein [unclassified Massilia]QNA88231.1 hypothetical protein G4G28_06455 [Massilia sp. Dwa41.01b]QNA99130.1 hypothetical protein G4G31_10170 [Massilia sp. Se16.2.3]